MDPVTIDGLETRQAEIKARITELDTEYAGRSIKANPDAQGEWNDLNTEHEANVELLDELRARFDRINVLARNGSTEDGTPQARARSSRAAGESRTPNDIFDLAEYRNRSRSHEDMVGLMRDGAKRFVETMRPAHERANREDAQADVERMLETIDGDEGKLSMHILSTGSVLYERSFSKWLKNGHLDGHTVEERQALQRAASLTTTAGGFAVPVTLDPTIIKTSNGQINPLREISRTTTITGNTWYGVSSAGITVAYANEATEASDGAPVLDQPIAHVEKWQALVPFSIEIGEDWAGFQTEMAGLISDGRDLNDCTQFTTGLGHASHVPQGYLVGATLVVSTAGASALAVGDLYLAKNALPPRFRQNASWVAEGTALDKVRQFDTAGGASLWAQLGADRPPVLLGKNAYENSAMSSAITTTGSTIVTYGDFSQGFIIIDKVGMSVELVPHLLATANNLPNGQRALYAYGRSTSLVLTNTAFRSIKVS